MTTIVWLLFTTWDLRHVNVIEMPWLQVWIYIIAGSLLVGPSAVLAAVWRWREIALESSRRRIVTKDGRSVTSWD
jgi:hypothetical protein